MHIGMVAEAVTARVVGEYADEMLKNTAAMNLIFLCSKNLQSYKLSLFIFMLYLFYVS